MNDLRTLSLTRNFSGCLLNEKFEAVEVGVNRKNINFAILKLKNNAFDEDTLLEFLGEASIFYALPKKRVDELVANREYFKLVNESKSKFRKSDINDGEGGELILYCINEDILKAPKILSKLKLKTNKEDYVKGADGIHILKIDDKNYEIILCESKMYADIDNAVYEAFNSIDRFIDGGFLENEIITLATNISGEFETFDVEFIANYVIPSKEGTQSHYAFSIFIGFEIEDDIDKSLDYGDYQEKIIEKVNQSISKKANYIISKLGEEKRRGYSFYVYLIPFFNIEKLRKKIIKKIEGQEDDK